MQKNIHIKTTATIVVIALLIPFLAQAAIDDCKTGYTFKPNTGVGCVQENCNSIPDAHYSYVGACICGTSGSIHEKDTDPNKECYYDSDNESCPGCLYSCVHLDEECPGQETETPDPQTAIATPIVTTVPSGPQLVNPGTTTNTASAPNLPTLTTANTAPTNSGRSCEKECAKLKTGSDYSEVLEVRGTYPDCKCTIDNRNENNQLTETIVIDGDRKTTYIFDPKTDRMISKNSISIMAEKERIRESLGVKYSEEEIDELLADDKINQWFTSKMSNIETNASVWTPAFWWQHMVALWDHGYGNSAEFVDTYNFGRCGDSMMWLEKNLAAELKLNGGKGSKNEAMLSITGEKYGNAVNHTALMIRPPGFSNIEWIDIVSEVTKKAGGSGLSARDIENLDPRILDIKVLDPYFKKTTTVREFIKGWSVIRMS